MFIDSYMNSRWPETRSQVVFTATRRFGVEINKMS